VSASELLLLVQRAECWSHPTIYWNSAESQDCLGDTSLCSPPSEKGWRSGECSEHIPIHTCPAVYQTAAGERYFDTAVTRLDELLVRPGKDTFFLAYVIL